MSDWAGPPQSSDTPRRPTDGVDALLTKLTELKRGLRDLPSGLLKQAGISISPEGMTIDSGLTVTGDTRIEGTLSLPQGIIDNDALAAPVTYRSSGVSQSNFVVNTTPTPRAVGSITVPEGFTRVTLLCIANGGAVNTRDVIDYLKVRAVIDGIGGGTIPAMMTPGGYATGIGTAIRSIWVTGGDVISVAAYVTAEGGSWGGSPANACHVDTVAWFTRA